MITTDGLLTCEALLVWRAQIARLVDEWRIADVDLSDNAVVLVDDEMVRTG